MIINSDVFDISKRIKSIEKDYLINWNLAKQRYEVVRYVKGRMLIELVVPYKSLDARLIQLLYKTSVKNINKIVRLCEKENYAIENNNQIEQKYQLNYDLKLLFR